MPGKSAAVSPVGHQAKIQSLLHSESELVMQSSGLKIACLVTLLLLSSCRNHIPAEEAAAKASASGPQDPDLTVDSRGYHGNHFKGSIYIPRASAMADGTTLYNVHYQPRVTVVSKEETMHHLVRIEQDGSYVFDAGSTKIAALQPGGVVVLAGLALATVTDLQKSKSGYTLKTVPAKITDAVKDGQLQGNYKIDFSRMLSEATPGAQGTPEFDVDFQGFNYHVRFTPGNDRVNVQATIKFAGSQGMLAYEGVGYIGNFVSSIGMQIKEGQITHLDFNNSNLDGQLQLKWFAVANNTMKPGAMAKITSWPAALLKNAMLSRAVYHVPVVLGAIPFDLQISLGFSFIPDFTAKNSVVEGSKRITYTGSGGFSLNDGITKPAGKVNVQGKVTGQDNRVIAVGPVGFTAAAEAPRLELAMGWPPAVAPVAGYLNFIASYGIVTNGLTSSQPCQTNIMAFSVSAGPAYTSSNTFADWLGVATGATSSVSLWQNTSKAPGPNGVMCPN